jgi:hypothetical protein
MHTFNRDRRCQRVLYMTARRTSAFKHENRPQPFASRQERMQARGTEVCRQVDLRNKRLQRVFDLRKKVRIKRV